MSPTRYCLLVLLGLTPALAFAQLPDSVHIEYMGVEYPAYGAAFGPQFIEVLGPLPIRPVLPADGCEPPSNPEVIDGSIALIERGTCAFVTKVLNAQAAGAEAVVVYNHEAGGEDLVVMGGDCPDCAIPAAFIARTSGLMILTIPELEDATIIPIRVMTLCGYPAYFGTNLVSTFPRDDGFIGVPDDPCLWGFVFMGDDGLGIASVLIGQTNGSDTTVTGNPYVSASEYEAIWYDDLTSPFASPFETFDRGFTTTLSSPLGVEITERAYARDDDAFIVLDLNITNTTGGDLEGIYVGLFADWNVGDAEQNLGGFNEGTNLVYVYDESGTSTNYFGVAVLGTNVSGWTLVTDEAASDPSLIMGLTAEGEVLSEPQDARTVVGVGPFDLAADETVNARFALVAGESEAAIVANAQAAQELLPVAVEAATLEGAYALGSAYPNPFSSRTTISFALPVAQEVRLAVYDVLGREVATLVDGVREVGEQAVEFEASGLPAGVYLVRFESGNVQLTHRLTLVH